MYFKTPSKCYLVILNLFPLWGLVKRLEPLWVWRNLLCCWDSLILSKLSRELEKAGAFVCESPEFFSLIGLPPLWALLNILSICFWTAVLASTKDLPLCKSLIPFSSRSAVEGMWPLRRGLLLWLLLANPVDLRLLTELLLLLLLLPLFLSWLWSIVSICAWNWALICSTVAES